MSDNMELFTSEIELVETSDSNVTTPKRAILKIPIINFGSNKKHLKWIPETMKKIASMFRGVPFRYDINGGNEGSHVRDHISSPFYDVGWTYSDERGAYYDPVKNCVWVKGEVTHPDVIEKLMRKTTDGKREINYASMGAIMTPDQTKCSICDKSPFGSCKHERGKEYGAEIAAMVPTGISKALHVALTNDPADKVAEIEQAIFQDMTECNNNSCESKELADVSDRSEVASPVLNIPRGQDIDEIVNMVLAKLDKINSLPKTEDSKMVKKKKKDDSKEESKQILVEGKDNKPEMADDDVKLDKKSKGSKKSDKEFDKKDLKEGTEEEGEHTTDKKVAKGIAKDHLDEDKDAYKEEADESIAPASVEDAKEVKEEPIPEDAKPAKESKKKGKKKAKKEKSGEYKDSKPTKGPMEMSDDSEFKISGPTGESPLIETQDTAIKMVGPADHSTVKVEEPIVETADNSVYEDKYRGMLIKELADSYVDLGKSKTADDAIKSLTEKSTKELEIFQEAFDGLRIVAPVKEVTVKTKSIIPKYKDVVDQSDNSSDIVPSFGGTASGRQTYAFQDMTPKDRVDKFGEYGSFDMCFHPQNASKYTNKRSK